MIYVMNQYLLQLSRKPCQPKDHVDYLKNLKHNGFEPKVIYDIGSCVLHWTKEAERIWPNAEIYLFDAFDAAEFLYKPYKYHIGVLGNQDGKEVKFYQNNQHPGGNSYYKEIGCKNGFFFPEHQYVVKQMQTLETVCTTRNWPMPDLIKIDVQGAETDIIQGSPNIIKKAKHLVVEMQHTQYNRNAPLVDTTLPFIESLGFKCIAPRFTSTPVDADYGFENIHM